MYNISESKRERESGTSEYDFVYEMDDLNVHVTYLMEEYIYQSSEHCVNISSGTRRDVINTFNDLKGRSDSGSSELVVMDLITLFDKALKETMGLLKLDSLKRFWKSRAYKLMMSEV